jgi:hypothetical protein
MSPNTVYSWEMVTLDGDVRKQYDEQGNEQTWKDLSKDKICRVSFVPAVQFLPRHEVMIDIDAGDRFVRRFGRGFIRQGPDGFQLKQYAHCVVTNRYRVYVLSNGVALVTHKDKEVYL